MSRIMVVEDNPDNSVLICKVLRHRGYEVLAVASGAGFRARLEGFNPELILMDVRLPDVDGLELVRQVRGQAGYGNIPIIATTAFAMKGDAERALASGCDRYFSKPLDFNELLQEIAELLPSQL